MNKEIYYWPISQISDEYAKIKDKKSSLSANDRKTVEHIYKQKLEKGALPEQKNMLKKSGEIITDLCGACLRDFFKGQGIKPTLAIMSKVFLFQVEKKEPDEHVRFEVMMLGAYVGLIIIKYENGTHSANFKLDLHGREKQKTKVKKRIAIVSSVSPGKETARAITQRGNIAKGPQNI